MSNILEFMGVWNFLIIELKLYFWSIPQKWYVSSSIHHIMEFVMLICLITRDADLDCLPKVVSVGFLHCKITVISFVINKYLQELLWDKSTLSSKFWPIILASISWSYLQNVITLVSVNGDFIFLSMLLIEILCSRAIFFPNVFI